MTKVRACEWVGCTVPVDAGHHSRCILHNPDENKDLDRFNQALKTKIDSDASEPATVPFNLSGVVFPAEINFSEQFFGKEIKLSGARFTKRVSFWHTRFQGAANFNGARFTDNADFSQTWFVGDADFGGAKFVCEVNFLCARFDRKTDFSGANFGGEANFMEAKFVGEADFPGATFVGGADFRQAIFSDTAYFSHSKFEGYADFEGVQFGGDANFSNGGFRGARFRDAVVRKSLHLLHTSFPCKDSSGVIEFGSVILETPQHVRFENVDLSRVSFLRTDVSQVQFVGCTWAEKATPPLWPLLPFLWPRFMAHRRWTIYDEVALDEKGIGGVAADERRLVAMLYRQLRLNYEASRQEVEAGHFYIGQMEMRRHDLTYPWHYRPMLAAYRMLAMYGESYLRPLFFYSLVGAVFALAYLWGGFQVGHTQVRYDPWPPTWGQAGGFFNNYVRAYVQALTAGGLVGTNLAGLSGANLESAPSWVPVVRYVNMLLDTFLVGFFVISLRRRFHR
jgi:uncharacterized protein YjbI with pentapeptide repeats